MVRQKNKTLKLTLRFSDEELRHLGDRITSDRVKKLVWLYSQFPVFINFFLSQTPAPENLEEEKVIYVQLSHPEELEVLRPFGHKQSRFVRHLLLNEAKILEVIGAHLSEERGHTQTTLDSAEVLQRGELEAKIERLEALLRQTHQISAQTLSTLIQAPKSQFKETQEKEDENTVFEKTTPTPPPKNSLSQKRQFLPPSSTGRKFV